MKQEDTYVSKAFAIGLGSMGKRRIRLLKRLNSEIQIIGVDKDAERTRFIQEEYDIKVFNDLDIMEIIDEIEKNDEYYWKRKIRVWKI